MKTCMILGRACARGKAAFLPYSCMSVRMAVGIAFLLAGNFAITTPAIGSRHYTDKQLAFLASRVGTTYWIQEVDGRSPAFLSAPKSGAASFRVRAGLSFYIVELVGHKQKNPYYKVQFDSGKQGYLRPETFLEELNLTLMTVDPLADEKRQAAEEAEREKARRDWINAQPWPAATKEAALRGRAVPGMTPAEVKKILGPPGRITFFEVPEQPREEHWLYPDGKTLVFQRGILGRTIIGSGKNP